MTGSARLMAMAAGRVRTGLVTGGAPRRATRHGPTGFAEPSLLPLPQTAEGPVSADAVAPLLERLEAADALAMGPGLTTNDQTVGFVRETVRRSPAPLVLDADGLTAFTGDGAALRDRQSD